MMDQEGKRMNPSPFVGTSNHRHKSWYSNRLQLPRKFIYTSTRDLGCYNRRQMRATERRSWDGVESVLWLGELGDLIADVPSSLPAQSPTESPAKKRRAAEPYEKQGILSNWETKDHPGGRPHRSECARVTTTKTWLGRNMLFSQRRA